MLVYYYTFISSVDIQHNLVLLSHWRHMYGIRRTDKMQTENLSSTNLVKRANKRNFYYVYGIDRHFQLLQAVSSNSCILLKQIENSTSQRYRYDHHNWDPKERWMSALLNDTSSDSPALCGVLLPALCTSMGLAKFNNFYHTLSHAVRCLLECFKRGTWTIQWFTTIVCIVIITKKNIRRTGSPTCQADMAK